MMVRPRRAVNPAEVRRVLTSRLCSCPPNVDLGPAAVRCTEKASAAKLVSVSRARETMDRQAAKDLMRNECFEGH
jgi:hypothetical protein